jgi:hypothetical protein
VPFLPGKVASAFSEIANKASAHATNTPATISAGK